MTNVAAFVAGLQEYRSPAGVFNPWRDSDPSLDLGPEAPAWRSDHLRAYLTARVPLARYILIAEAVGYQGGRFSGVAMTSERMLLGRAKGVDPTWAMPAGAFRRTSRPELRPDGFAEPTATIVWSAMVRELGVEPREFILWNAFPFHPFKAGDGLTNRTPTTAELAVGGGFARRLVALCPHATVIAIGQKSGGILREIGIPTAGAVRHPANGGATEFRRGLSALLQENPPG